MSNEFTIPGMSYRHENVTARPWRKGDGALCSNNRVTNTFACGAPVVTITSGRKFLLCAFHLAQRYDMEDRYTIGTKHQKLAIEELIGNHREEFAAIQQRMAAELHRERIGKIPRR
ncbi:hypothetical protein GS934_00380 [Rhodococcus hoagii]|nr:hypothetical protein [Prescottella equi]NKZ73607.1 hypothetical protein [Prescottella equi]NKZ86651.1 hypothetical protein [Prescottella equi]